MTGNPFLTMNKAKWDYPGFFSYFSNQGTPKEDFGDFVLVCLTPFQQFPCVVSTISLPQRIPLLCLQMDTKGIIGNYTLNKCEWKWVI